MLFIAVQPTGDNPDNKIADITLDYHVPGSAQVVTQTVTLQYPSDGGEMPSIDAPYLSAPEMAKRYAMYNLFLGLRDATAQTSQPACAASVLATVRTHAASWNATREDPDFADDVSLIDHFIANLQAVGGYGDCGAYPTDGHDAGFDDYPPHRSGDLAYCSAGAPPGWLAMVGLALVVGVKRRRRR